MNVSTAIKHRVQDESANRRSLFPAGQLLPFVLVTVLFFMWGIPNNLNDVLIRQFMKSFAINRLQAGLVQFAFYLGYFFLAMPAALLMRKAGYKIGFVIGLLLFGAGCFLFWPAALAGSYAFFLCALFVIASGLFRYPHFLWAVVAQFLYVGAQVGTWSYFIQYVQESTHQPEKIAGYFLTGTLAAFGVGRFASAYLMRSIAPNKLMGTYSLVNIGLVALGVLFPGWLGLWCIFLTSFFMSLMFPTIFALGLKGLGPNTKIGGSLLVMAIVGGAVMTPLMGFISEKFHSIAWAYVVPLFSYLVIALYSFCCIRSMGRNKRR
jgi:fucose permease